MVACGVLVRWCWWRGDGGMAARGRQVRTYSSSTYDNTVRFRAFSSFAPCFRPRAVASVRVAGNKKRVAKGDNASS